MKELYINLILLFVMLLIVIYLRYYGFKPEFFELNAIYKPIPFIPYPKINNFTNEPTGYDSGTREYNNYNFAQQVAQGLDTNL